MWGLPAGTYPYIFVALVALVAVIVRRTVGWGWLIAVCLGLSALATVPYIIWVYRVSPLSPDETRAAVWWVARTFFLMGLILSGMVVWLVALIVPPRVGLKGAPAKGPSGKLEDSHELLGISRRYEALLLAHSEARQQAVGRPWYRAMFGAYVPPWAQEDWRSFRQSWRVPDFFKSEFVAAAPVLTALHEMPPARLSALEAYHRVNLAHVRQRLFPAKILASLLSVAVPVASGALPSVITTVPTWNTVGASILAFVAQPQHWGYISPAISLLLGLILVTLTAWWMRRRLEALGELLTVALAARREERTVAPLAPGTSPWTPSEHGVSARPGPSTHALDRRDGSPGIPIGLILGWIMGSMTVWWMQRRRGRFG